MKAAVISLGSISSQWTAEAMKKYFTEVDSISLKDIEVRLGKECGLQYQGKPLPPYDCVYVKGSFRYAHLLCSITTMLENKVAYLPLRARAFMLAHNKLLTHLALQEKNIPMPTTYVLATMPRAKELLKQVHYPIVVKFPEGTQGKGVMFADSESSAVSLLDALGVLKQPCIIQEYIETEGTDIRALVVGDKVIAAMRRKAQKGDNRANIHAGGTGELAAISPAINTLALRTAEALDAEVCGVDILESPLGPLVIEVNISPGLQGLQNIANVDLAEQVARHFFQKTEAALQKEKKKEAGLVMNPVLGTEGSFQQIVTTLQFRGEKIILPEIVGKIARFHEGKEQIIKVRKGKVEVEER